MQDYQGIIHVDSHAIDNRTINKPAQFTNYTPGVFSYSHNNYEVALSEIQYQHSWYNLPTDQYIGFFDRTKIPLFIRKVPAGHYSSIDELIAVLNSIIFDCVQVREDKEQRDKVGKEVRNEKLASVLDYGVNRKIMIKNWNYVLNADQIAFSIELANVLGFSNQFFIIHTAKDFEDVWRSEVMRIQSLHPHVMYKPPGGNAPFHPSEPNKSTPGNEDYSVLKFESRFPGWKEARRPFDISGGVDQIFIYTNLIKPHMFGNQTKQLLRVIAVERKDIETFGQNITKSIVNPQFYPLFETTFDKIEIEIRDRTGQLIPFTSGSVIVTLEIRQRTDGGGFLF